MNTTTSTRHLYKVDNCTKRTNQARWCHWFSQCWSQWLSLSRARHKKLSPSCISSMKRVKTLVYRRTSLLSRGFGDQGYFVWLRKIGRHCKLKANGVFVNLNFLLISHFQFTPLLLSRRRQESWRLVMGWRLVIGLVLLFKVRWRGKFVLPHQNQHVFKPTWVKLQCNRHSKSAFKSMLKMAKIGTIWKTFLKRWSLIGHLYDIISQVWWWVNGQALKVYHFLPDYRECPNIWETSWPPTHS